MNSKLRTTVILFLMAALLYACAPSLAGGLSGAKWTLTGLQTDGNSLLLDTPTPVTLEVGKDGAVGGSAGCNSYFGSADFKTDGRLEISEVGSTEMYCMEGMEIEAAYLGALVESETWSLEGDTLIITAEGGATRLVFSKPAD